MKVSAWNCWCWDSSTDISFVVDANRRRFNALSGVFSRFQLISAQKILICGLSSFSINGQCKLEVVKLPRFGDWGLAFLIYVSYFMFSKFKWIDFLSFSFIGDTNQEYFLSRRRGYLLVIYFWGVADLIHLTFSLNHYSRREPEEFSRLFIVRPSSLWM